MTLHDAVRHFMWDATHDYRRHDAVNGQITALYALGLYAEDLARLMEMVPGLSVTELRRIPHDVGDWLRVDVVEPNKGGE